LTEIVLDGLTGPDDGMDRDAEGRIWLAMFADRTRLLTWAHEHTWIKPLLMRIPAKAQKNVVRLKWPEQLAARDARK
jgi:hypothetical protein